MLVPVVLSNPPSNVFLAPPHHHLGPGLSTPLPLPSTTHILEHSLSTLSPPSKDVPSVSTLCMARARKMIRPKPSPGPYRWSGWQPSMGRNPSVDSLGEKWLPATLGDRIFTGGWVKQEWVWELGPLSRLTLGVQPLPTPGPALNIIRSRGPGDLN